ncbi:T9SS type A sorting domain-containing protein, partial [Williamwhitmania taraxaci]
TNTADYTDGWYDTFKYTANYSGKLVASSCGQTTESTYLQVSGGCNGPTLGTSDDEFSGQSRVAIDVIAGSTYYFTWRCKSSHTTFPWTLSFTKVIKKVEENSILVTPNPTNGQFSISLMTYEFQPTEVIVIGLNGNIIYSSRWESGITQNVTLHAAPGIYSIIIKGKGETLTKKLIIQ